MGLLPIRRVAVRSRIRFVPATLAIVGLLCGPTLARASANELEATALGGSIGSGNLLAVAGIGGRVLLDSTPVAEAKVFAYQLVEKSIHRVLTDGAGSFLFESLPAGIYKIIAHKAGFAPTVLLLQRQASDAAQFVTLELEKEPDAAKVDFWSVRSQIPGDVLRELEVPAFEAQASASTVATAQGGLSAEVSALTGVTDIKPEASARLSGGNVGVAGQLGDVKVYLQGNFQKIESESGDPAFPGLAGVDGSSRNVSINLQTPNQDLRDRVVVQPADDLGRRPRAAGPGVAVPVRLEPAQRQRERLDVDPGDVLPRGERGSTARAGSSRSTCRSPRARCSSKGATPTRSTPPRCAAGYASASAATTTRSSTPAPPTRWRRTTSTPSAAPTGR
ncbi:MAG: carboxypeptidase-like regulatory domain-containing protein [Thermoanaerobaculia bacterium]